jgi:hypothetical protein
MVSSILQRLGIVRTLQPLWRKDVQHAAERSTEQTKKLMARVEHTLQERVGAVTDALAVHHERQTKNHDAIDALRAEVARLGALQRDLERRARGLEQTLVRNRDQAALLARFRAAVADGRISDHVSRAIDVATLVDDPAPLLTVDGFFPPDVYELVLASIPPREVFAVRDRTKADFRARRATLVPELTTAVWSWLEEDLLPRTVVPRLAERFRPYVASYYRDLFGPSHAPAVMAMAIEATGGRLMRRTPGYHLDPHLDPKRVLMTGLLYLARPGDPETYGTSFYRVDGHLIRDHSSTYYPVQAGHACDLAQVVPFRANTAAVFLNSAAHGADIPASAPRETERFAYQFYIGPPVEALKDVIRTMPAEVQVAWAGLVEE